jgi:hypothetical protein
MACRPDPDEADRGVARADRDDLPGVSALRTFLVDVESYLPVVMVAISISGMILAEYGLFLSDLEEERITSGRWRPLKKKDNCAGRHVAGYALRTGRAIRALWSDCSLCSCIAFVTLDAWRTGQTDRSLWSDCSLHSCIAFVTLDALRTG